MAFELWEIRSGNLIDTFPSEAAALEEVRATIVEFGREAVATYALAHETGRRTRLIAEGEELADRAVAAATPAESAAPSRAAVPV
jgi:hypothetical protein